MNRIVLDASVALAWCFPDEGERSAMEVLRLLRTATAVVPSLWPLEIANVILNAERRKRLDRADGVRFLGLLESLPIEVDALTASRALADTLSLARERGLSAYDAAYLELAMREGLPLATLDRRLRDAAVASGARLVTA